MWSKQLDRSIDACVALGTLPSLPKLQYAQTVPSLTVLNFNAFCSIHQFDPKLAWRSLHRRHEVTSGAVSGHILQPCDGILRAGSVPSGVPRG